MLRFSSFCPTLACTTPVALAQYSITAGLKKFKDKGNQGVTKELTQMHDMSVFRPIMKEALSKEERAKALASLMLLKEKRDKSVKARMCADGRKQRGDLMKPESTSPTVSTESVFITAVIEAHVRQDVACVTTYPVHSSTRIRMGTLP
jgi:hypothetical protein